MAKRFTIKRELTMKVFNIPAAIDNKNKKILDCDKHLAGKRKIKRKYGNTSIILNCTRYNIYDINESIKENKAILLTGTYIVCIYDVLDKLSIVYIHNDSGVDKILIFEDVRLALKWFDKINNFISHSIRTKSFEENIIKNDKYKARKIDYFLTLYNILGKYSSDIPSISKYSNMYFVSDIGIVSIKDHFNEEPLESINIQSFYGHYFEPIQRMIFDLTMYSNIRPIINSLYYFMKFGNFISTKTIENIINEDIKDLDKIDKEEE